MSFKKILYNSELCSFCAYLILNFFFLHVIMIDEKSFVIVLFIDAINVHILLIWNTIYIMFIKRDYNFMVN